MDPADLWGVYAEVPLHNPSVALLQQLRGRCNGAVTDPLVPHLPRLVVEWASEAPDLRFREVEGSMVFVDLSGFTALSERLARKGREGAERITDIVDATFTHLLDAVYAAGGTLLKFGGDALLLLFTEDGHELRAARTAWEMRRRLDRTPAPERGVKLSMTVGVGSGVYQFFLVGTSHRELIVAGPAATRTAGLEEAAESGEVVVGRSIAGVLDAACLGPRRGAGRLLVREPEAGTSGPEAPAIVHVEAPIDVSSYVPVAIRDHVLAGGSVPEHRNISVAFVRFAGIDRTIRREGLGAAAAQLHDLVTCVQEAVDRHAITFLGSDIYADGGKFLLVSGAPDAREDSEDRMLLALRDISRASAWKVRIGVNAGWSYAGSIGPPYRRTYTVMGDDVNLAARVMTKCRPGSILATDSLLDRARTTFATRSLAPFAVKGKTEPVHASRVGEPTGVRASRREDLPVIGRGTELGVLARAVAAAAEGRGSTVELIGEAGIGKTTLLRATVDAVEDMKSLWVSCEQHESSTPYAAAGRLVLNALGIGSDVRGERLERLVRERTRAVAPELVDWLPLVGAVIDVGFDPTQITRELDERFVRQRMLDVVGELVERALATPTVIIVDDVHWMDSASRDVVDVLSAATATRPWLLLVVSRPSTSRVAPDAQVLEVGPVDASAAADLARAVGGLALLPQQIAELADRAGGHPLFVIELASAAVAAHGELPETLGSLLAARIDTLEPPARRVLRELSVLGSSGDHELIAGVAARRGWDVDAVWPSLEQFFERDAAGVRFKLAVIRAAAYQGLPFRERRAVHELAGVALEQRGIDAPIDQLSLHFHEARSFERSYRYSKAAAERANERFAYDDAVGLYERALEAARWTRPPADEVAAVWHQLGLATHRSGRSEAATAAYRRALRLTNDGALSGRLCFDEGEALVHLGRLDAAMRWYRRGLRTLEGATDKWSMENHVRLLMGCAVVLFEQGRYARSERLCREAIDSAEATGDTGGLAHAYNLLFDLAKALGDPRHEEYGRLSLVHAEETGNRLIVGAALNNLGTDAQDRGRWTEATEYFAKSRRAQEQAGSVIGAATVANNLAEILSDQGYWDDAERTFHEALRVAGSFRLLELVATSNLGRVASRRGDHARAEELLTQAAEGFRAAGVGVYAAECEVRLAENELARGSWKDALARLDAISGAAPHLGVALHRLRGYALWQSDDRVGAYEAFTAALAGAGDEGHRYEAALAHQALAKLARSGGGEPSADERRAAELFDELGVIRTVSLSPGV